MSHGASRYAMVDSLYAEYVQRQAEIRHRLADFAAVSGDRYFYELVYCLLTPQSSAVNAGKAVALLEQQDLLGSGENPAELFRRKEHYIRFHNTKARHVLEARKNFAEITIALHTAGTTFEVRQWLVRHVKGFGWKEASHFLRNIGHRNVAILDRHILKNLRAHNVLRAMPTTLTPARYLATECNFVRFADTIGIPMDELDLLFWSRETGEILK